MPRRKKSKLKPPIKQVKRKLKQKPEDLEEYIREANEVQSLTTIPGWHILERDLMEFRNSLISKLAYIDPSRAEHREARVLFMAIDKLFTLVSDYRENKIRAIELLGKLKNPDLAVAMDYDHE